MALTQEYPRGTKLSASSGISDAPSEVDHLEVGHHVMGLARFIEKCDTPLTIALQGGWGTGKSTILGMVQRELSRPTTTMVPTASTPPPALVFVDVWQSAWEARDEDIVVGLVMTIVDEITRHNLSENDLPELTATKLRGALRRLLPSRYGLIQAGLVGAAGDFNWPAFIAAFGHGILTQVAENAGKADTSARDQRAPEPDDEPVTGDTVRSYFRQLVEERFGSSRIGDGHPTRLVVFIDNLDRIRPERAVEIMECLKAILDAPHCVFVVAVDFDVVAEGIVLKYPNMQSDKARAFFDKIIQLPFQIPVSSYAIDGLLKNLLPELDEDGRQLESIIDIIGSSVGSNPRSIKRLVNSYRLLTLINQQAGSQGLNVGMIAQIALQIAYPDLHQYLDDHDLRPLVGAVHDVRDQKVTEGESPSGAAREAARRWLEAAAPRFGAAVPQEGPTGSARTPELGDPRLKRLVDDVAALIDVFAEIYDGADFEKDLRTTWRITAVTATESTMRTTRAQLIGTSEVIDRLQDLGVSADRCKWAIDLMGALANTIETRGGELRSTMPPGDKRLRLSLKKSGSGAPSNIAKISFRQDVKVELSDKMLNASGRYHEKEIKSWCLENGWSYHYSEKYDLHVLQTHNPGEANALGGILDKLIAV